VATETPKESPLAARDPDERSLIARVAAAERWGRTADRTAATQPARDGHRAKFRRQVDPDGTLDPIERERRVDALMTAHLLRMSLAARRARARARRKAEPAEQVETMAAPIPLRRRRRPAPRPDDRGAA
jgi:hypothetical protein